MKNLLYNLIDYKKNGFDNYTEFGLIIRDKLTDSSRKCLNYGEIQTIETFKQQI